MIELARTYLGIGLSGKYELMDYYNEFCYEYVEPNRKYKIQRNDDWCAMFTTVIANKCGISASGFPYEVSVWYQSQLAKKRGLWFTDPKLAKPNDLIVFDWGKGNRYNHVGFVTKNDGVIHTIEGNKDRTVSTRIVRHESKSIKGFIRSSDFVVTMSKPEINVTDVDTRIAIKAVDVLLGKYGDGDVRRRNLGDDYHLVQALINSRIK